ncbi:hypothetical protein AB0I35_30765 [Nocardia sp. NPDC050378]|uniref:hypothetical protein n=1 Tax=Nocardia sp. NPDC050378 TaxID=3155400 RepID=UPI0033FAE3EC
MPIENPYKDASADQNFWFKGSLHAHSTVAEMYPGSTHHEEDTPRPPEEVLADYKEAGYEFVVFSEQNDYTTQQDINDLNLDAHGVTVIPGVELDGVRVKTDQHLGHINPSGDPRYQAPDPSTGLFTLDQIIDRARKDPERNDATPGKPHQLITQLHPQFPREVDGREKNILDSKNIDALEIVNSWWMQRPHAFEDSAGKYSPFAFHLWDRLLKPVDRDDEGKLVPGTRVWGVAGCCSVAERDVGVSWIKVWLDQDKQVEPKPDVNDLMRAISNGAFYFSAVSDPRDANKPAGPENPKNELRRPAAKGVTIYDVTVEADGKRVRIDTDAEIVYAIVGGSPRLTIEPDQKTPTNSTPGQSRSFTTTFPLPDPDPKHNFLDPTYIRFECVGRGPGWKSIGEEDNWDQSYDWDNTQKLNRSWTQPLWITP